VAYVTGTFPAPTETFVLTEMTLIRDEGLDPVVCALRRGPTMTDPAIDALLDGARFRPLPTVCIALSLLYGIHGGLRERVDGAAAAWFAERLADAPPTHVHAHFLGAPVLVGHALARMLGATFTFACHAADVFTAAPPAAAEHAAIHDACRIVACSDYLRDRLISERGYPPEKVVRIPHGVDLARIASVPKRAKRAKAAAAPVVGAVGRLVPKKGLDVMLRAVADLVRESSARVRIVGDGPERVGLESLAASLGIGAQVEFAGALPWAKTLEEIVSFSVLAVPSVQAPNGDVDGLPNVILEAGALGVPVVASAISAIPELVCDGETGWLSPSGDAVALGECIRAALNEQVEARRRAGRLREVVRAQWDARVSVREVAALMRQESPDGSAEGTGE
jgi:glycosyltransferase involved in cell wall biosynthesis